MPNDYQLWEGAANKANVKETKTGRRIRTDKPALHQSLAKKLPKLVWLYRTIKSVTNNTTAPTHG